MKQQVCSKRRYNSEHEALKAMHRFNANNKELLNGFKYKEHRRVYECEICDSYHLTSKPRRLTFEEGDPVEISIIEERIKMLKYELERNQRVC